MARALDIYWDNMRAGRLEEISPTSYRFEYDETYRLSEQPPVSLTLPKSQSVYVSNILFPCFINLLPEGVNRKTICRRNKIDEHDFFGMLMFFAGKDVIGNLEFRLV